MTVRTGVRSGGLAALVVLLGACATMGAIKVPAPAGSIPIADGVSVGISSIYDNQGYIVQGGKRFSPTRAGDVIAEVTLKVVNDSSVDYEYSLLSSLEMIVSGPLNSPSYVGWTKPFDLQGADFTKMLEGKQEKKSIKPQASFTETVYFVHPGGSRLVALAFSRAETLSLIPETDPAYPAVLAYIKKDKATQTAFAMARMLSFDIVQAYLKENELKVTALDAKGLSLLCVGIMYRNNSVVDGALAGGCDPHQRIQYSYHTVEPMHLAVLAGNEYAVRALMKLGIDVGIHDKGMDEPAVVAIRDNNVGAAKLLKKMGVDLKAVKLAMGFGPTKTALDFAKSRNMDEMVRVIEE